MPQGYNKELFKRFSFKNVIKRKVDQPGELPSPDFEVPITPAPKKEDESTKEQLEKPVAVLPEKELKKPEKPTITTTTTPPTVSDEEAQKIKEVENILAEDLQDVFIKMDPITKQQFKVKGEDTARAVHILFRRTKIKIKEVIHLIIDWLKLIPGVNKFFVEQEAKIKADRLLAMKRRREREEG